MVHFGHHCHHASSFCHHCHHDGSFWSSGWFFFYVPLLLRDWNWDCGARKGCQLFCGGCMCLPAGEPPPPKGVSHTHGPPYIVAAFFPSLAHCHHRFITHTNTHTHRDQTTTDLSSAQQRARSSSPPTSPPLPPSPSPSVLSHSRLHRVKYTRQQTNQLEGCVEGRGG